MKSRKHNAIYDLCEVFLKLKTVDETHDFLKDLCTPQEMNALAERWKVCRLLEKEDLSYREIRDITGASLTTIGRVARFLKDEPYCGYQGMLKKLKNEK